MKREAGLDPLVPVQQNGQAPDKGGGAAQQQPNSKGEPFGMEAESGDRSDDGNPPPGGQGDQPGSKERDYAKLAAQAAFASAVLGVLVLVAQLAATVEMDSQRRLMGGQLRAMRNQVTEMRSAGEQTERVISATRDIAAETKNIAAAALQSAQVASDQFALSQAALVTGIPDVIPNMDSLRGPPGVTFFAKSGYPALHLNAWSAWTVLANDDVLSFKYPEPETWNKVNVTLANGDSIRVEGRMVTPGFTDEDKVKLKSGQFVLVIYGTAVFDDGRGHFHFDHACQLMRYQPTGMIAARGFCPSWNDTGSPTPPAPSPPAPTP